jgi:hypothetical protein
MRVQCSIPRTTAHVHVRLTYGVTLIVLDSDVPNGWPTDATKGYAGDIYKVVSARVISTTQFTSEYHIFAAHASSAIQFRVPCNPNNWICLQLWLLEFSTTLTPSLRWLRPTSKFPVQTHLDYMLTLG